MASSLMRHYVVTSMNFTRGFIYNNLFIKSQIFFFMRHDIQTDCLVPQYLLAVNFIFRLMPGEYLRADSCGRMKVQLEHFKVTSLRFIIEIIHQLHNKSLLLLLKTESQLD